MRHFYAYNENTGESILVGADTPKEAIELLLDTFEDGGDWTVSHEVTEQEAEDSGLDEI